MRLATLPRSLIIALGVSLLSTGCTLEQYLAKPLQPAQVTTRILSKDPTNPDFKAYLIKQGVAEGQLPFTEWGLNELTLCALYYNPRLDVAKAQLALANASLGSAGQKQNPTLGGNIAHSNQKNGDIRPWAYGLSVEIPVETGNKRQIRAEEAQHMAEAARLNVAEVAWQLRSQIAKKLLRYHENIARQKLLQQYSDKQAYILRMLEKRASLGVVSNTEIMTAKLLQQNTLAKLSAEKTKTYEIRAALASDAGLTIEKFNTLQLKPLDIDNNLTQQSTLTPKDLQEKALLNRLDIRRSLAEYAAAEAKIKLEVAKQTPDISLSPGIAFEFGDTIWSLGFSALINLLNKNQTLIAEATALREVQGAQFEVLQAKVIGDLGQQLAIYEASQEQIKQIKLQQTAQLQLNQRLQRQFDAGLIDRLELTQNALNSNLLAQQLLSAQFNSLNAALALEDLMQHPIFDDFSMNTEK